MEGRNLEVRRPIHCRRQTTKILGFFLFPDSYDIHRHNTCLYIPRVIFLPF